MATGVVDRLAGIPQPEAFLRRLDAWRFAEDNSLPRYALWVLACGLPINSDD